MIRYHIHLAMPHNAMICCYIENRVPSNFNIHIAASMTGNYTTCA
jgi:hypothetical protein